MKKAIFEGLVSDERGNAAAVAYVGEDPTYVVEEDGFKYHVDSGQVDGQVLGMLRDQVSRNKDLVIDGMMKFLGKDDLFTKIAVDKSINEMDKNTAALSEQGIPEQARAYLGMLGFRIVINRHGDVLDLNMPSAAIDDGDV